MKKNKLLKAIFITVIVLIIASWIIPTGVFNSGTFNSSGYEPYGVFDILLAPFQFFNWNFIQTQLLTDGTSVLATGYAGFILVILTTGILYAVLNRTGAYGKLIEDIAEKVEKHRKGFLIGTSLFFLIFSSFVGLKLLAFLLIPFFITILRKLDFSKISIFVSTFLSTLLGSMVSLTGTETIGVSQAFYEITLGENLVLRILLLALVATIMVIYLTYAKEPEIEEEEEEDEYIVNHKKSYIPLVGLSIFTFVILLVGSYNWYYVFNNVAVTEAYENLMATAIGTYPVASNILGMMEPFGYWTGFTISAFLMLLSLLIAFVYAFSWDDMIESVKEGLSRYAKVAIYVVLASISMVIISTSGHGLFMTIASFIQSHITKLAVPFTGLMSAILGFFIHDFFAITSIMHDVIVPLYEGSTLSLSVLAMQMGHGLVTLIAPSSFFLVAGLTYMKIPYQKWLSYIWKFFLILAILVFAILMIINLV